MNNPDSKVLVPFFVFVSLVWCLYVCCLVPCVVDCYHMIGQKLGYWFCSPCNNCTNNIKSDALPSISGIVVQ